MLVKTAFIKNQSRVLAGLLAFSALLIPPLGRAQAVTSPLQRASTAVDPALLGIDQGSQRIIVQKWSASDRAPERAVARLGGQITRELPIVRGFSATLDARATRALAGIEGIRAITLDRRVHVLDTSSNNTTPNSPNTQVIRANQAWASGLTGKGVTIAVIDTGIADVTELKGRIVPVVDDMGLTQPCMNFSGEAGCQDSYGHGTFVAGVIASAGKTSQGLYKGVAPEAKLVSVKLSGRDGSADVSALLAAIQWVVSMKDVYGIKALNLSIGTDSPQSYRVDPLNFAVERAWQAGITVVVAASNRGPTPGTITKPGDDPWVVTVGAMDDNGTVDPADDAIPDFSGRGPTLADAQFKPDLVAPGAHIVSLRAPNSAIEQNFPTFVDNFNRKGSGTSFATPAVVGTVALMLQRDPTQTPDRLKYALMNTTVPTASANPFDVGTGLLNSYAAIYSAPAGTANQGLVLSTGLGSLDASRGTLTVQTNDVVPVSIAGNTTQQLSTYDVVQYTGTTWSSASWHTSQWTSASWHSVSWHSASWHSASWHSASWHSADGQQTTVYDRAYGVGWLGSALLGAWE